MHKDSRESAPGAAPAGKSKKRWERPKVAHADVREVTRGGINMMSIDPIVGSSTPMMS